MQKICFVSYNAYSLFNPEKCHTIGGSEVRAWLFARGLAKHSDMQVHFVVASDGVAKQEVIDNITIHHHPVFTHKKFPVLDEKTHADFLNRIDAEIFIIIGVHDRSFEIMRYAQKNHKEFVLIAGSDNDCSEEYKHATSGKTIYGSNLGWCHELLENTKHLVCQTERQQHLFSQRYGIKGIVIKNPVEICQKPTINQNLKCNVLWIGRSDTVKCPEMALRLALRFPNLSFTMIMNRSVAAIHEKIIHDKPSNVTLIDYVPYDQMNHYYAACRILLNTSVFEGFPNTFLQAGCVGKPILSLSVNPDDLLTSQQIGFFANDDFNELVTALNNLNDSEIYASCSKNILEYVKTNHDNESQAAKLAAYLRSIDT